MVPAPATAVERNPPTPAKPNLGIDSRGAGETEVLRRWFEPRALRCAGARVTALPPAWPGPADRRYLDEGEIIARAIVAGERHGQKVLRRRKRAAARYRWCSSAATRSAWPKKLESRSTWQPSAIARRDQMPLPGYHDGGAVFDAAPQTRWRRRHSGRESPGSYWPWRRRSAP